MASSHPSSRLPPFATRVDTAARAGVPVVIRGARRTDRLLVGQRLHARGSRSHHPFRVVACEPPSDPRTEGSAIPQTEDLQTALRDLESSGQGTLFVDRVDCLPPSAQLQLLQALQTPVLTTQVIAGTQSDLAELVAAGSFLPMLCARLKGVELVVPPGGAGTPPLQADTTAEEVPEPDWSLSRTVKRAERAHLVQALRHHNGNRTNTASSLGISRKNLWEKMKAHRIHPHEYDDTPPN